MYYIKGNTNKHGGFIICSVCGRRQIMHLENCEYEDDEGYIYKQPIECKCGHKDTLILKNKPTGGYTPHCPTCGSPNIHKISATNKVGSAVVFGLFAVNHVGKIYKCDNCGAEW